MDYKDYQNQEEGCTEVIIKCQEWFVKNSLYLTKESRNAFYDAFMAAFIHPDLKRSRVSSTELKENFQKIRCAGEVFVEAVSLPSLGDNEYSPINDSKQKQG